MHCMIDKRSIFVNVGLSTEKKIIGSTLSLIDVTFQSHTFETTKWVILYVVDLNNYQVEAVIDLNCASFSVQISFL